MKHKIPKGCLIAIASLLVVVFGMLTLLDWAFSDHEFRYGSFEYWLSVDSEIDKLPLIGAKRTGVLYMMEVSDGPKPPILSLSYTSKSDPKKILDVYKAHYAKLGYSLVSPDQLGNDYLKYQGKGKFAEIGVFIYPNEKSGNLVSISYVFKI